MQATLRMIVDGVSVANFPILGNRNPCKVVMITYLCTLPRLRLGKIDVSQLA